MAILEKATTHERPLSGEASSRIRRSRAADWALIQEPQSSPGYHAVFDRVPVRSDTRLLDVGCGAGLALSLAAELGATVAGIDASAGLLEVARKRLPKAQLELGDIEALPFEDRSFDVVTGFNAFQFAADPVRALEEARRVSRPGGQVFVMTWCEPQGMEVAALAALLPPMPEHGGLFALSGPGKLEDLADTSGLVAREIFDLDAPWTYPDLATAQRGLASSGVAVEAAETRGQEALDAADAAALAPFVQPDGSYRIGATLRILMADCPNEPHFPPLSNASGPKI